MRDAYRNGREDGPADLVERSPAALAYFDKGGTLKAFNRRFSESFPAALRARVVEGAHYAALIPDSACTPGEANAASGALVERKRPKKSAREHAADTFLYRTGDGHWLVGENKRTSDGGMLCSFHDVTALKTAESDLRRQIEWQRRALVAAESARHEAEISARTRADYLAKVSHELRTPLNAILGFSEVLKNEMFGPIGNERYREYGKIIHDSGSHLLGLINDVLDMSKLEAGKLEMHFAPVEICKLIIDCVRGVEPQAKAARVGVCVVLHDNIGWINGDGKRLRQMLLNLLSNAIKFTPPCGEVRVSAFRSGGSVAIAVSDTGIGIAEDDIPRVLEPYTQIDSKQARQHEGTGLGLPLTKELAEAHGGRLTIESTLDVGTTATILLPYDATNDRGDANDDDDNSDDDLAAA